MAGLLDSILDISKGFSPSSLLEPAQDWTSRNLIEPIAERGAVGVGEVARNVGEAAYNRSPFGMLLGGGAKDTLAGQAWDALSVENGAPSARAVAADVFEGAQLPINETIAGIGGAIDGAKALDIQAIKAPNEGETKKETEIRNHVVESAVEKDPQNNPRTVKLLGEEPNAPIDKVVATKSQDGHEAGKKAILAQGGTPEDVSAWDKFNEEYDLTTIGLSLLMSNNGQNNLSQNMGLALQAGRNYKVEQREKQAASEAAGREEGRADAEVAIKQEKNRIDGEALNTARYSAQATAAYQKAKLKGDLQIAQIRHAGDAAGAGGITVPNKTEQEAISAFMDAKVEQGGFGAELADPSVQVKYAMNVKQALELAPPGTDPQKVMDDVWNATITTDNSWNSIGPTYR